MLFIVLVGPKHSGKTSAGKELAALLGGDFIDLDEAILRQCGKSPRELYAQAAEIFRKAEAEALAAILETPQDTAPPALQRSALRVIAAGGGIIDNPGAMALLAGNAEVMAVFIDVSAQTAWERISRGELPPFLRTDNPKETHRLLHERRSAAYRKFALLAIEADGKNPDVIAGEIANALFLPYRHKNHCKKS